MEKMEVPAEISGNKGFLLWADILSLSSMLCSKQITWPSPKSIELRIYSFHQCQRQKGENIVNKKLINLVIVETHSSLSPPRRYRIW